MQYINNKNKEVYNVICRSVDRTANRDVNVIIYASEKGEIHTREETEFYLKFTPVSDLRCHRYVIHTSIKNSYTRGTELIQLKPNVDLYYPSEANEFISSIYVTKSDLARRMKYLYKIEDIDFRETPYYKYMKNSFLNTRNLNLALINQLVQENAVLATYLHYINSPIPEK